MFKKYLSFFGCTAKHEHSKQRASSVAIIQCPSMITGAEEALLSFLRVPLYQHMFMNTFCSIDRRRLQIILGFVIKKDKETEIYVY